jgi:hypothetical protein
MLDHSTSPKIIGRRFPQVSDLSDGFNYDREASNSVFKANIWRELPPDLAIPNYILHGHAMRTDLISSGGQHSHLMLISKDLKKLFQDFKLPKMQTFETKVISRKDSYEYLIWFMPENHYQFIDFSLSSFALVPMGGARPVALQKPEIHSLTEFEKWVKEYPYSIRANSKRLKVVAEKLVLDTENIPFDMFRIIGPVSGYFLSERLKNAIQQEGLTGMEFVPLEKIMTVLPPP